MTSNILKSGALIIAPPDDVQYYDVPPEYGIRGDRYTVVSDRMVLVDPDTHRII
jgi:hypothetical protein